VRIAAVGAAVARLRFDIRGPSAQKSTGTAVFAAKKTQPVRRDGGHASKFWNYGNFDDNTIN
jgi:hypothetical protein